MKGNCFSEETHNEIKQLIEDKSKRVLLLCDGGNKMKEVETFCKYLKSTDIKKLIVKRSYPDWINKELEFMKENYSKMGARYCSKKLNKSMGSIYGKAFDLNINKKWSKTKD